MPEQNEYFDKFLEAKFTHIDASVQNISNAVSDLKGQFTDLRGQFTDLRNEVKEEIKGIKEELTEVKTDNKSTRHWILGSAITFFVGFIAAAIAIFFGFAQLQTSWIQQVISFISKIVVK
jgi:hypothetical protein